MARPIRSRIAPTGKMFPTDNSGWLEFFSRWYIWLSFAAIIFGGLALLASNGIRIYSARVGATQANEIAEARRQAAIADEGAAKANSRAAQLEAESKKSTELIAEANARAKEAEAQVARANAASKDAVAKVAAAEARIAEANRAAAEASAIAEKERLARLQLEARLAPRTLTSSQQSDLTRSLAGLKGRGLDVLIYGGDAPEIIRFANLILKAIIEAGWTVRVWSVLSGGMSVSGVLVATKKESDTNTEVAANALTTALRSQGVVANRWDQQFGDELPAALTGPTWDTKSIAPIRMLIGAKP